MLDAKAKAKAKAKANVDADVDADPAVLGGPIRSPPQPRSFRARPAPFDSPDSPPENKRCM
ncbi:hypothetical protein [Streptomyces nondiastaticus]|uniref:Uncharacterized protein n=1 Tax=Streptomyces nondiastaticus TaxID=3154512 RepID=A0ABW6U3I2_9ACTN